MSMIESSAGCKHQRGLLKDWNDDYDIDIIVRNH